MVADSFIFYRSFAEAIDDLPDTEQLMIYRTIKEYALNGKEIELSGIPKTLWKLIKPQLQANSKRREDGSKGGRPKKDNQWFSDEITSGYDGKEPNVNENNNNNNDNVNVEPENIIIFDIKQKSKEAGFDIDDSAAKQILTAGILPGWLEGPDNFLIFTAKFIRERYSGKTQPEQRKLFLSALCKPWPDLKEQFPEWRDERHWDLELLEKERQVMMAKKNKPEKCQCGGVLNEKAGVLVCQSCNAFYDFDGKTMSYVFNERSPIDFMSYRSKTDGLQAAYG